MHWKVLVVVAAGVLAISGWIYLAQCRRESDRVVGGFYDSQEDAQVIQTLLQKDQAVTLPANNQVEYGVALRKAAEVAKIPLSQLSPELGARRAVPDSSFERIEVVSNLGNVSLSQLIVFLHELAEGEPAFQIGQITLVAAMPDPASQTEEVWTPSIDMTYLSVSSADGR